MGVGRGLALVLLFLVLPSQGAAQETPVNERDQLLFADLSLGVVSAGYEHILAERIGLSGAVGIYGPWYIDRPVDIFAFNAEFRVFWYILGTASKAQLYVSPAFRLGRPRADDDGRTLKGISYAPRVSAGGTFRFGHFFFRLGIGIQHENVDLDRRATGESVDIHRVTPVVDAYVGAAF